MRVKLERSGGLANIHRSIGVDADTLAPERAQELRRLIAAADLDTFPEDPTPLAGQLDRLVYQLTVEDETRAYTVRVYETSLSPELRDLLDWIERAAGA
jgi:hypothetical protein